MANIITNLLNKRRNRTSADSEDSISSPEHKKTRTTKQLSEEEDEIWTALNMSETVAGKLEDLEGSRLTTIFIKMTTHLNLNLQDMFQSFNDHLQLKVELI